MKLLLDTHVLIWWSDDIGKLSATALTACQDSANTLLLSIASVWEMQIKIQLGRLKLNLPLAELVESQQQMNSLEILPVMLTHVLALQNLGQCGPAIRA